MLSRLWAWLIETVGLARGRTAFLPSVIPSKVAKPYLVVDSPEALSALERTIACVCDWVEAGQRGSSPLLDHERARSEPIVGACFWSSASGARVKQRRPRMYAQGVVCEVDTWSLAGTSLALNLSLIRIIGLFQARQALLEPEDEFPATFGVWSWQASVALHNVAALVQPTLEGVEQQVRAREQLGVWYSESRGLVKGERGVERTGEPVRFGDAIIAHVFHQALRNEESDAESRADDLTRRLDGLPVGSLERPALELEVRRLGALKDRVKNEREFWQQFDVFDPWPMLSIDTVDLMTESRSVGLQRWAVGIWAHRLAAQPDSVAAGRAVWDTRPVAPELGSESWANWARWTLRLYWQWAKAVNWPLDGKWLLGEPTRSALAAFFDGWFGLLRDIEVAQTRQGFPRLKPVLEVLKSAQVAIGPRIEELWERWVLLPRGPVGSRELEAWRASDPRANYFRESFEVLRALQERKTELDEKQIEQAWTMARQLLRFYDLWRKELPRTDGLRLTGDATDALYTLLRGWPLLRHFGQSPLARGVCPAFLVAFRRLEPSCIDTLNQLLGRFGSVPSGVHRRRLE